MSLASHQKIIHHPTVQDWKRQNVAQYALLVSFHSLCWLTVVRIEYLMVDSLIRCVFGQSMKKVVKYGAYHVVMTFVVNALTLGWKVTRRAPHAVNLLWVHRLIIRHQVHGQPLSAECTAPIDVVIAILPDRNSSWTTLWKQIHLIFHRRPIPVFVLEMLCYPIQPTDGIIRARLQQGWRGLISYWDISVEQVPNQ
jgi:hypothetical protein